MNLTLSQQSFCSQVRKSKRQFCIKLGIVVFQLLFLSACGAVTPVPPPTLTPTTPPSPTSTSTPKKTPTVKATSTLAWIIRDDNDCFNEIELVPRKTTMDEVFNLWGEPSSVDFSSDDSASWNYDKPWQPNIYFLDNKIEDIHFYLDNCFLGDVIEKLGPPDAFEFETLVSCIGAPADYIRVLHYPSRGFAFYSYCATGLKKEECLFLHPEDEIGMKKFYVIGKHIESTVTSPWPGISQ